MDVKSLYTNIRHTEGIQSIAKALEDRKDENMSTRVIIKFLSLISIILYSMTNITNKTQVVQWGANVLQRMQTYLWIGLKGNIYIPE